MKEQTKLWDFVNNQIETSHLKRVSWKSILGFTLTEYITNLKETYHFTADETYNFIILKLQLINADNEDILRRLKISVYARYCEQGSYNKRNKQTPQINVGFNDNENNIKNIGCIDDENC